MSTGARKRARLSRRGRPCPQRRRGGRRPGDGGSATRVPRNTSWRRALSRQAHETVPAPWRTRRSSHSRRTRETTCSASHRSVSLLSRVASRRGGAGARTPGRGREGSGPVRPYRSAGDGGTSGPCGYPRAARFLLGQQFHERLEAVRGITDGPAFHPRAWCPPFCRRATPAPSPILPVPSRWSQVRTPSARTQT